MDFETIKEIINTMGFPILMVGYFIMDKKTTTQALINAIENNTNVITRLCSKLGVDCDESE